MSPGEAVPNVAEVAERSWWQFRHYNPRSAEDPRMSYVTAYRRGYRDCLADTAEFVNLQRSVERLVELLEESSIEREAVRMTADEA